MAISSGINLVMTVIGFAVSTMFIVFVCTRLICARIQLRASRRNFPTASISDLSILERGLDGLEPVVVAGFPTKEFGEHFSSGQDTQCIVCLAEYQERDILRVLPYCRHSFHISCIDIWLKQHATCPVCRISLRESPDQNSGTVRSHYPIETFALDFHHYLYYSETIENNQRVGSTQEDQLNSEPSLVPSHQETKAKYMESPSNAEP